MGPDEQGRLDTNWGTISERLIKVDWGRGNFSCLLEKKTRVQKIIYAIAEEARTGVADL